MMHCRKATHMLSEAQDRTLSVPERLSLYMHLGLCRHCRNFSRHLGIVRQATQAWRKQLEH